MSFTQIPQPWAPGRLASLRSAHGQDPLCSPAPPGVAPRTAPRAAAGGAAGGGEAGAADRSAAACGGQGQLSSAATAAVAKEHTSAEPRTAGVGLGLKEPARIGHVLVLKHPFFGGGPTLHRNSLIRGNILRIE